MLSGCTDLGAQWEARVVEDRQAYFDRWGDKVPAVIKDCILNDKIRTGMTRTQVKLAWYHNRNLDGFYWAEGYRRSTGSGTLEFRRDAGYLRDLYDDVLYTLYFDDKGHLTEWVEWNP
jgi:hypothetical protein